MKNLSVLPDRWAVNIEEEAEHPRMGEFKEWMCRTHNHYYGFSSKYYGFNIDFQDDFAPHVHVANTLPEGVPLITLDRFFEELDAPVITDAGKETGINPQPLIVTKGEGQLIFNGEHADAISELPFVTDWQPKRGEMVDYSDNGEKWHSCKFYEKCGDFFAIKADDEDFPTLWKFIRPFEQPTQLLIEDAKKAYAKALNLEGKKIDWV